MYLICFALNWANCVISNLFQNNRKMNESECSIVKKMNAAHYAELIKKNGNAASSNPLNNLNKCFRKDFICWAVIMYKSRFADISFIESGAMQYTRISTMPWKDAYTDKILNPSLSPVYFGLTDTAYVTTRYGSYHASTGNKTDMASAVFNGRPLFEQWLLTKKDRSEEIMIDTGGNVLAFFADYSVNNNLSRAVLRTEFEKRKFYLDFNNADDSGASFIAAKVTIVQDKEKINSFQPYSYPGPGEPALQSNERLLGSIKSVTKQLTLAIWDDAVEDGDTISISINGTWITKGLLVKKAPQFITITLNPGPNTILFEANNLGSIPPNTSVLEIIDGKRRKAFFLETVPLENNLLKIFYDYLQQ